MIDINEFLELFSRFPKGSQIFQFMKILRDDNIDFPNSECFRHLQNPMKCALYLKRWLRVQLKEISKNDLLVHQDLQDILDSTPAQMCKIFKQWFPIVRVRHLRADTFCHTNIGIIDVLYFFVGDIELKWPLEDYLIAANSKALINHWGLQNLVTEEAMLDNWRLRLNYYNYCRQADIPLDDFTDFNSNFDWRPEHKLFTRERTGIHHSRISGPEISAARKLLQAFDYLLNRSPKRPFGFSMGDMNSNLSFDEMGYQLVELVYTEMRRAERIGDRDNVISCDFQENQDYFKAVNSLEAIGTGADGGSQNICVRTIINKLYKLSDTNSSSAVSSHFLSHTLQYVRTLLRSRKWYYNQVLDDYNRLCDSLIRESMSSLRIGFEKVPEAQLNLFYDRSAYSNTLEIRSYQGSWLELHESIAQVCFGRLGMFEFEEDIPSELNLIAICRSFQLMFFIGFVKHHWMLFFHSLASQNLNITELPNGQCSQSYFKQLSSKSFLNAVNQFDRKIFSKTCRSDAEVVNIQYANRVLPKIYEARSAAMLVLKSTFRHSLQEVAEEAAMEEGVEQ